MILSLWKLTHNPAGTPTVLLDYLDPIEEEPKLVPNRGLEIVSLVDAEAAFLRRTPGETYTLTFTRERTFTTDILARQGMLDAVAVTLPTLDLAPVRLDIQGVTTRYYQFANAFATITAVTRKVESAQPRILETLSITGTGFTRVIVTP
jgi:hypothetical protein